MADSWQRHRETLDSLIEGFQIIGHDWTYLYVNPAAAQHGRKSPEELIGRRMMDAYPSIEETPIFKALERCMRTREATSLENQFTFPDRSSRWFEVRIQPVAEGICVLSVDIQARKEAEALLREQESITTLGRMAAVVAHEVKNPLAGLAGALQVLRSRRPEGDAEIALFDQMLQVIDSLDTMLQDLLIFARPMRVDTVPVAIADVVQDALLLLDHDETLKPHVVRLSGDEPAPIVKADRDLLKNVFRNLLLNAAEAMVEPGSIEVCMTRDESACRVTIADTGPGVSPEMADRIFEPFVTGRKGGTGLGLAISRRILRLHGGDLELVPPTGQGATMRMTIPLHLGT